MQLGIAVRWNRGHSEQSPDERYIDGVVRLVRPEDPFAVVGSSLEIAVDLQVDGDNFLVNAELTKNDGALFEQIVGWKRLEDLFFVVVVGFVQEIS